MQKGWMRGAAVIAVVLLSVGGVHAQSSEYLDFDGLTAELRTLVDAGPNATMRSIGAARHRR